MIRNVLTSAKLAGCQVAYPWAECVRWARMVGQEFAAQVAKEKEAGLTVSVFMDVHGDVQLAKLQARNPTPFSPSLTCNRGCCVVTPSQLEMICGPPQA